ncbi:MAG: hypothetical protein KJ936_07760 [Proteobacteria bacterium]|nr:hypothetical protein [Pseudomonadota bacterium]MBU2227546.1 hypothetical protein [Pseudomonadota bacterium]MBU2260783.1 hypothetical protein [Pseudomonadota bacterium]
MLGAGAIGTKTMVLISHIPEELQPYLPLLGKITLNMGAGDSTYEEMAKRITLATGGLSYHSGTSGSWEPPKRTSGRPRFHISRVLWQGGT